MRVHSYVYSGRGIAVALALVACISLPGAPVQAQERWAANDHAKKKPANAHRASKNKKADAVSHERPGTVKPAAKNMPKVTPKSVGGTANKPAVPPLAPGAPLTAPVLDLSAPMGAEDVKAAEKARREILGVPTAVPAKPKARGTIDFGGGANVGGEAAQGAEVSFDFGNDDAMDLNLAEADAHAAERQRLEAAMGLMADEAYDKAAMEFRFCLTDPAFVQFVPEVQYQLGRALYKLGFYAASHAQFQQILQVGPSHRRFRKAVEWLFFMSRKVADQEPVLAELAKFRNVTFPKAYHDEYDYLLAKYLFLQANSLEVRRLQDEELMRGKQSKESTIDFGAVASAIAGAPSSRGQASTLDFSSMGGALDFGGNPPAPQGAGGLDFGAATEGGALDFGAAPAAGGALDFGSSAAPAQAQPSLPTTTAEAVKQGLDLVAQVGIESAFYPRAKYLEGLLHYLGGAEQKAVDAYQEVVRVLGPKDPKRADPKLREMAFLSLARIHFGHKQFNRSAYYYDLIDRDSENWLTALFEASWAYYQRGDYEKALGNLLTLHSPFFEQEYFPESQIVRATIYFEGCRYAETRRIVDDFIPRYTRLMHEMQKVAESHDPPETIYAQVMQLAAADPKLRDDTAVRVLNLMLRTPEIQTAQAVVQQVDQERQALSKGLSKTFRQSTLGNELAIRLNAEALEASQHAGEAVKQKFEQELYKLKSLLGQALRIKIEVARSERDILEARAHNEPLKDEVVPAVARTVVDDEHVYWPYEGEYWRDELGTYELDFSMCRQLRE
jgi:outer membrane protein assembly factor BamD (BamD/ComL family)